MIIPTDEVMEDEDNLKEIQVPQAGRFQLASAPLKTRKYKTDISKNNTLRPMRPMRLTPGTSEC